MSSVPNFQPYVWDIKHWLQCWQNRYLYLVFYWDITNINVIIIIVVVFVGVFLALPYINGYQDYPPILPHKQDYELE